MERFLHRALVWSLGEIMTKIYIAKDSDRLDTIVYNHYGHLRFFEQVLALNPKLATTLKAGDKVFLPEIKEEPKEQNKLW